MMSAIRFVLYNAFSSLAKLFIDREIKRHQAAIFNRIDAVLPSAIASGKPQAMSLAVTSAIANAIGGAPVPEQVRQVRDLFDPVAFAKGLVK